MKNNLMKPHFKVIIVLSIIFSYTTKLTAQTEHIGLWKGEDLGDIGFFNFDSSGYAYIIFEEDTMGGDNFYMDEVLTTLKYEVSYSDSIHSIDLILYSVEGEFEMLRMLGIFMFNEKNSLVLCLNFDGYDRPESFVSDDTIILHRMDE